MTGRCCHGQTVVVTVGEQVSSVIALCCVGECGEEVRECHVGDTLTDGRPTFGATLVPL